MMIGFYLFMGIALFFYFRTVGTIWRLVEESKGLNSNARFDRFNWTPAWKGHRIGYPESPLRRQIVTRFLLTFVFMIVAMAFLGYAAIHPSRFF